MEWYLPLIWAGIWRKRGRIDGFVVPNSRVDFIPFSGLPCPDPFRMCCGEPFAIR